MVICPSTALAVAIVIVIVAAEEFVKVLSRKVIGTVPAFEATVTALFTSIILLNLFCAVQVCTIPKPPTVAEVAGNVMVVESVPESVRVLVKFSVLAAVPVRV